MPCSHQLPGTFHTDISVENNMAGGGGGGGGGKKHNPVSKQKRVATIKA